MNDFGGVRQRVFTGRIFFAYLRWCKMSNGVKWILTYNVQDGPLPVTSRVVITPLTGVMPSYSF